jgi:prephenate dehydrogenase
MANVSIGILGLKRTGTSIGLALKRYNQSGGEHQFKITGYDTDPTHVRDAQRLSAVDNVVNRIEEAARDQDIVVMALPGGEVKGAYQIIANAVRPGAVVLDASIVKSSSLRWATEYLPDEAHIVGFTPIVNPKYLFEGTDETKRATEDYFDNGTVLVTPSVHSVREAIELASDFAKIVGASPFFFDADEHDALFSATEVLPSVLGAAFFHLLSEGRGWGDMQRVSNPNMGMLTHHLFDTHPDDLRDTWLDSGQELVRHLDGMIGQLREVRQALATQDRDALEALLETSSEAYESWINRRYNNRWQTDDQINSEAPGFGSMMGNMFGTAITNRFRRDKNDEKD